MLLPLLDDDRPDWDRDGRDWPHRAASRFVDAAGLRWHLQEFGAPQAPGLLLLHGTGAATHSWRGLAPLLAERDSRGRDPEGIIPLAGSRGSAPMSFQGSALGPREDFFFRNLD